MASENNAHSNKNLPRFIVYQPDPKEFHICLETGRIYYVWSSNYPPTQDSRFARKVTPLKAILPKKIPKIYDEGTYTVNKGDDKLAVEKKIKAGIKKKSFSFILNGKVLKGRFIIKRKTTGIVLQKFKDQFAVEEDVLGNDLSRTIRLMVPDYDPGSVRLNTLKKQQGPRKLKQENSGEAQEPAEAITADKQIGNTTYHFAFYRSTTGPDLCIITNDRNEVLVLQRNKKRWELLKAAKGAVLKKTNELAEHAQALSRLQDL